VTLLELYKKERNYGRSGSSIVVWNIVVMDASFAVFKVVLNSHIQDVSFPTETGHHQPGVKMISGRTNTIRHENPKSFGSCKVRQ
jgi:hypothetical protein